MDTTNIEPLTVIVTGASFTTGPTVATWPIVSHTIGWADPWADYLEACRAKRQRERDRARRRRAQAHRPRKRCRR